MCVGGFAHVCMSVGREAGRKRTGMFIKLRDNCAYKMHLSGVFEQLRRPCVGRRTVDSQV